MKAETSRWPAEIYSRGRVSWMQRLDVVVATLLTLALEFVLYATLWIGTEISQ